MKQILAIALLAMSMSSCIKDTDELTTYEVNSTTSVAEWKASGPDRFHAGAFRVSGSISSKSNGIVSDGSFTLSPASMDNVSTCPVHQQLPEHLKTADFFNMALYPDAEFRITKVVPYATIDTGAVAEANYLFTGSFTMAGQTHAVSFPAKVNYTPDSLQAEATFRLDRTKWGMRSYSDPSQALYILPNVAIHLRIQAAENLL